MQIELDGPGVVGGMVSGVVRVDDDADGDDIEIQLVWVERSGQKFAKAEKARVVARADASPETDMRFSLAIPESTSPGWSDSTCSFNLEVKVKQNFLKSPIAEVVEIDQNSFPSPTEAHVAEISGDVRKGRRRVLSGEVLMIIMMMALGLGVIGAGIYFIISPPGSGAGSAGVVFVVVGLFFALPSLYRLLRSVRPLGVSGCGVTVSQSWLERGETFQAQVTCRDPINVSYLCRIHDFCPARSQTHDLAGGRWRRTDRSQAPHRLKAGSHLITFRVSPNLPPSYGGHSVVVRHMIVVTKEGDAINSVRRTEIPVLVLR